MINEDTVVFKPQNQIKKFYEECKRNRQKIYSFFDKTMSEFLTTDKAEARKIYKYTRTIVNLVKFIKNQFEYYLNYKGKGNGSPEDTQKIRFAKLCTELTYTPPNEKEIYENLEKAKAAHMKKYHPELVKQIVESAKSTPDSIPKTITVTVQPFVADSAKKPLKRPSKPAPPTPPKSAPLPFKAQKVVVKTLPITPPSTVKELVKLFEGVAAKQK